MDVKKENEKSYKVTDEKDESLNNEMLDKKESDIKGDNHDQSIALNKNDNKVEVDEFKFDELDESKKED